MGVKLVSQWLGETYLHSFKLVSLAYYLYTLLRSGIKKRFQVSPGSNSALAFSFSFVRWKTFCVLHWKIQQREFSIWDDSALEHFSIAEALLLVEVKFKHKFQAAM